MPDAAAIVPTDADLPGSGWLAIDEGFAGPWSDGGAAELFDCVGPTFPEDRVTGTAASPHYVHPPRTLVHGIGVAFADDAAAGTAADILRGRDFAACLGRSVAADLESRPVDTELLAIDVEATALGHRVRFTGGDEHGVRPVHLDVVALRVGVAVGLLWFGDTPEPFPDEGVADVVEAIRARISD